MTEVHRLLRKASLRLAIGRFVRWTLLTLTLAVGALGALIVLERLFAISVAWPLSLMLGGLGALVLGAAIALLKWPTQLEVAREVDERAALRETLSTALCVENDDYPWSRAAVAQARDAARRVSMRTTLPPTTPRAWPAPLIAGAVVGVLWLALPQWDLLGYLAQAEQAQQREQEIQKAVAQVSEADKAISDALRVMGEQPESGNQTTEPDFNPPEDPEAIRQMAVKKLTSVSDRLAEARKSAEGQMLDAMRDSMSRLKRPGEGPLEDVAKALQQGNFKAASEELSKLLEQMAQDGLSDVEKAELIDQLESMTAQMAELAERQDAMEQALSDMGLDPSLARDPQALQDAIRNAPGLTDAQRQALEQAMEGMQNSQGMMQQMAQAMGEAAQQMQQGQQGQEGQQGQQGEMGEGAMGAMGELAGQLSEMEMLQAEMDQLDAASQDVWGQLSQMSGQGQQGQGQEGGDADMLQLWDRRQAGNSTGKGPGGGDFDSEESPFMTKKEKSVGEDLGGPIVGTRLVDGDQIIGESRAEFEEAVRTGSQSAADAIESQRIPREFHDTVKHYFGRLDAKAKGEKYTPPAEGEATPATESETPREGEGDGGSN
jgi:hypothetical protein